MEPERRIGRQPVQMTAEQQARDFQLWDFRSSLGGLMLLRSFGAPTETANLDIVFFGAMYMEIASCLCGIAFAEPEQAEIERITGKFEPDFLDENTVLYKLISEDRGYLVVATTVVIYENHLDFSDSSLEHIIRGDSKEFGTQITTDSVYGNPDR